MTKKSIIWISMLFVVPIIAGIYGVIHDQITYSISPEYFTNFKFIQFGISPEPGESERFIVALVGFFATWWVGVPIGVLLGGVGIVKLDEKAFLKLKVRAIFITFITTFLLGFTGYVLGLIGSNSMQHETLQMWQKSDNPVMYEGITSVKDVKSFVVVGYIHTFSYLGGIVGFLIALFYQFRKTKFLRKELKQIFNFIKEEPVE